MMNGFDKVEKDCFFEQNLFYKGISIEKNRISFV